MGLASLVLGLVGVSISWLPGIGLLAVPLGFGSVIAGLLVMTSPRAQDWHWQYGLGGSMLSVVAIALSGAFQFKRFGADLAVPLADYPLTLGLIVMCVSLACVVIGILIGRSKSRSAGVGFGVLAVAALCLAGSWTLTIADREYSRTHPLEHVAQDPIPTARQNLD